MNSTDLWDMTGIFRIHIRLFYSRSLSFAMPALEQGHPSMDGEVVEVVEVEVVEVEAALGDDQALVHEAEEPEDEGDGEEVRG